MNTSDKTLAFPTAFGKGLTRQEYFAAKAMQGLVAGLASRNNVDMRQYGIIAEQAVAFAEALEKEFEKIVKN